MRECWWLEAVERIQWWRGFNGGGILGGVWFEVEVVRRFFVEGVWNSQKRKEGGGF